MTATKKARIFLLILFVSPRHGVYDAVGIAQYRINVMGYPSMMTAEGIPLNTPEEIGMNFINAHTVTSYGYTTEFKVPTASVEGDKVGLNIQINDKSSDTFAIIFVQPQNSMDSGSAWDGNTYDYIVLGVNPATDDNTLIYSVLALISSGVFVFIKKSLI